MRGKKMIVDLDDFKKERFIAMTSGDVVKIREFAVKYGIKIPRSDQEVLDLALKAPTWQND